MKARKSALLCAAAMFRLAAMVVGPDVMILVSLKCEKIPGSAEKSATMIISESGHSLEHVSTHFIVNELISMQGIMMVASGIIS